MECGQSDGATGALYRKDRVSQSVPDAGHVATESVQASVFDRTLALEVTGRWRWK